MFVYSSACVRLFCSIVRYWADDVCSSPRFGSLCHTYDYSILTYVYNFALFFRSSPMQGNRGCTPTTALFFRLFGCSCKWVQIAHVICKRFSYSKSIVFSRPFGSFLLLLLYALVWWRAFCVFRAVFVWWRKGYNFNRVFYTDGKNTFAVST